MGKPVSCSLTSPFSINMAISETNGETSSGRVAESRPEFETVNK